MSGTITMHVLSQQIADAIAGRRVRTAVFTTFSFDPGFFELNILPLLFDRPFAQPDKVRRLQLDDALGSVQSVTVYYDQRALSSDAEPAQLDYRRIDVSRSTGYFHPKLVLLLVDEPEGESDDAQDDPAGAPSPQALIVAVMSANLTRAGWWESVECAHIEEIKDHEVDDRRCSFRRDLLSTIRRVKDASPNDNHAGLDAVKEFLLKRTSRATFSNASSGGHYYTRLFCGQGNASLADFLGELRLYRHKLNLEVISPFFDHTGAGPLTDLIKAVVPRETRVYLPTAHDGAAEVTAQTYQTVAACDSTHWAKLPGDVVSRGKAEFAGLSPRRVHAKVYRLWRKGGPDLIVVGSPNLTNAGHSPSSSGNLEAAFLVDVTAAGPQRWWLDPLDRDVKRFAEATGAEDEGLGEAGLSLSLQFDWATKRVSYRILESSPGAISILDATGRFLYPIERPRLGRWHDCGDEAASIMADVLRASSFVLVESPGYRWRLLVREEEMGFRPSLLIDLTPEEILHYWSLLTPAQRSHFLESTGGVVEGLQVARQDHSRSKNTLFDRFGGIYHAFGCLRRHIEGALGEGREADAETRLFGAKYDSLPSFLQKTIDRTDGDVIAIYVTFLCARQLRDEVAHQYTTFVRERRDRAARLDGLLKHLPKIRASIPLEDDQSGEFLDWYEDMFLTPVSEAQS